jgi:hypothetical protein
MSTWTEHLTAQAVPAGRRVCFDAGMLAVATAA